MPNKLTPPPPTGTVLDRWLALLYQLLTATGQILWPQVSKAGSNLTDIETRNHADLQNINTASYTHLTAANHTDLTDGGDSTLHFHASDRARANHTGTQESDTVLVSRIGSPTYTTLQHFVNLSQSAGRISGGALSDAGSANLNVAAGTGWLRIADDDVSDLKFFNWSASNGNAIPAGTTRYVGVEYNAGSPQVVIKTSDTWNEDTEFQLGEVSNESGTLHIINNPFWVGDAITNIIQRFSAMQHVQRDNSVGGLTLGETGTRNITVSASKIWSRLNDFTFNAFSSATGGTFDRYYRNGSGGWTREAAQTQWPNTQYDDGSGTLVTMTNNRYANLWVYAETDGDVVLLYGQAQYTSASAAEIGPPPATLPERLRSTGLLIGRIIFQKSSATATTISSAFTTVFNPAAATDHELLANLLGGAAGEHYHLTAAQHTANALKTDKLSAFAATTSAELAGVISDETGSGALVFGTSPTVTGPTISSGNLAFSGTAQRITGLMDGGTVANRLAFQTSTTNGNTNIMLMPNGTGNGANFQMSQSSDLNNAAQLSLGIPGGINECRLNSGGVGTFTYLPFTFFTSGSLRVTYGTDGHVTPGADNTQNFGSGALRWKEIFAGNATINTSDAREKTPVRALSAAELNVAKQLSSEIGVYQWLNAITEKGDGARLHCGMTVQRAIEIFVANGIDPFRYGLVCYDEWGDKFVEHRAGEELPDGSILDADWTEQTQIAGNRYGFRGNELLLLIAAGFNARLSALESA